MIAIRFFIVTLLVCTIHSSFAMVYDIRLGPFYKRPYTRTTETQSRFYAAPFFLFGRKASADDLRDSTSILSALGGPYDQNKVREAIIAVGGPDFFDSPALQEFKGQEIIWRMNGKLSGQGVGVVYDQYFGHYLSGGLSFFVLHAFNRSIFALNNHNPSGTMDEENALDIARREMDAYLGIEQPVWEKTAFSDIDFYLRLGNVWDYTCKFKRIDAGFRIGLLVPTGVKRNFNNPSSLPFGGDGHWGIYTALDGQAELKEDLSIGALFQYNQRFERTRLFRIPAAKEQLLYGAVVAPICVDPNATIIFSPYAILDNIREGLGARVQYTVVSHLKNSFTDKRQTQVIPSNIEPLIKYSDWVAEYITVDAFFDFGRLWPDSCISLLISGMVDIPMKWFFSENSIKTTRLSIGFQFTY